MKPQQQGSSNKKGGTGDIPRLQVQPGTPCSPRALPAIIPSSVPSPHLPTHHEQPSPRPQATPNQINPHISALQQHHTRNMAVSQAQSMSPHQNMASKQQNISQNMVSQQNMSHNMPQHSISQQNMSRLHGSSHSQHIAHGINTSIHGTNTSVYGANTSVHGTNTSIHGTNTSIHGTNTSIHGTNTSIHGINTSIHGTNTSIHMTNTSIHGTITSQPHGSMNPGSGQMKTATAISSLQGSPNLAMGRFTRPLAPAQIKPGEYRFCLSSDLIGWNKQVKCTYKLSSFCR